MNRIKLPEQKLWDATILAALDAEPEPLKQTYRIDTRHGKIKIKEKIPRYAFEEGLPPEECPSFEEVAGLVVPWAMPTVFEEITYQYFRKHLVMTEGLVDALKIIYAVVLSTYYRDDVPLWMDVVAPPSAGKTMLLSCVKDVSCVLFKSRITPAAFVSGDRSVKKDPSILGKLNNCCLVWKDFTEFLSMHFEDKERIYAAMRGAYDGHSHTDFGNGVVRDYPDIYFTMLTGVTPNIYLDSSVSLGERRLKFKLPRTAAEDEKQKIRRIISKQQESSEVSAKLKAVSTWFIKLTHERTRHCFQAERWRGRASGVPSQFQKVNNYGMFRFDNHFVLTAAFTASLLSLLTGLHLSSSAISLFHPEIQKNLEYSP